MKTIISKKRKNRRGLNKNRKNIEQKVCLIGVNCAGLSSKMNSFKNLILKYQPCVFFLQETKFRNEGKLRHFKEYQTYELIRKDKRCGGLAIGALEELEPAFISEGDDETEILVIEINLGLKIRCVNGYGPQENDLNTKKQKYWDRIGLEAEEAIKDGKGFIVQMDGNLHCGPDIVSSDPNPINANGKYLKNFLEKYPHLNLVNSTSICEGTITRKRVAKGKVEAAILDFFICCDRVMALVTKMVINEDEKLARFTKERVIESDHCPVNLYLDVKHPNKKKERIEIYDYKNSENQEVFRQETSKTQSLSNNFRNPKLNFKQQVSNWKNEFDSIIKRSFKKIRLTGRIKESYVTKLINERNKIKSKIREANGEDTEEMDTNLKSVEIDITNKVQEENFKIISENFNAMRNSSGTIKSNGLWKIKNKMFPSKKKKTNIAKKNKEGKLITNPKELKELYLDTYVSRLRNRRIMPGFENLEKLKTYLCQQRLELSSKVQSSPLTRNKLNNILKSLKLNKASDPGGLINELFRPEKIGDDLKESLFLLLKKVKEDLDIPDIMEDVNITSIPKSKGAKNDLKNDRGIFSVNIFRSLLLKIIYNDEYDTIDSNMSDSNVGGRKRKNIRNHIFIVNGVINEALKNKTNIDIEILDYRQCFDGMWLEETINDLFEAGLVNDNLNLVYKLNEKNQVAVVTPHGLSERVEIRRIIMQGENLSPLECSVQVDKYGKECMEQDKYLFRYRDIIPVPPLSMVDDLLCISKCGIDSVLLNAFINLKTNTKKLQFGEDKCFKMHVGRDNTICPDLLIDKWNTVHVEKSSKSESSLKDVYAGKHKIEDRKNEKYLGDIIDSSGKNHKNIEKRVNKGFEKIKQIIGYLEDICFGKYHFEVAKILRETIFLNSILLNSEAWYSLDKQNIEHLEKIDNILLNRIFELPSSTPSSFLHLELGTLPIRFVIMVRRLNFLQYILKEEGETLINSFLVAQMENPLKGDWWGIVKQDIVELKLDLSLSEIKMMSQEAFKKKVKVHANEAAFVWLNNAKSKLKKIQKLNYSKLFIQNYLKSENLSVSQRKFLTHLRGNMIKVKMNFSKMHTNLYCPLCSQGEFLFDDCQEHLLHCKSLSNNSDIDTGTHYQDIFSEKSEKYEKITILLEQKMILRDRILNDRTFPR